MRGLTVRWSLADAPAGVEEELASYVADTAHARFTGMAGLRFTTWRVRRGEWFEACHVFTDEAARAAFEAELRSGSPEASASGVVGAAPVLVEPCDVVGVAEGWEGFRPVPEA